MRIFWFLQSGEAEFRSSEARALSSGPRWVMWLTLLTVAVFLAWADWAKIDQITRAPGSVIASSKTQVIQSQEGGILESMMVKEGDRVERGDPVVYLERTQAESVYLESLAKQAALLATVSRLRSEVLDTPIEFPAELEGYPQFVSNQRELYVKRKSALVEELDALGKMGQLVRDELALNKPLLRTGDVSKTDILRLERQLADLESQQTNIRNKFFQEAQAELGKYEEELAAVKQQLAQRKDKLEQTTLYAPVNGIVKNIAVNTEGGVVRPGEEILQIVPIDDVLVVEAKVSPADIAFVRTGLPATIKIDAYDYTIYGDLSGTLTYISADTLTEERQNGEEPYYRIQVRTENNRFSGDIAKALEILPGMTASVEIKTGSNTVLHYLTKPLTKTLSESLGER